MIYVAFYKGDSTKKGVAGLRERIEDKVIRCVTKGPYSHCEIAVPDNAGYYSLFSSSPRDKGVRTKTHKLNPNKWDILPINVEPKQIIDFYNKTQGLPYDILGVLGIVLPFKDGRNKYFCSEWCYNAIFNSTDGFRVDPNRLYSIIKDVYGTDKTH